MLWGGPPDSETPAARTTISESAPATDVLDVTSGSTGAGGTETNPATDDADGDRRPGGVRAGCRDR